MKSELASLFLEGQKDESIYHTIRDQWTEFKFWSL